MTLAAWVDTEAELRVWADRIAAAREVGIDTEANSMFVYRAETCTIQITVDEAHAIVDPLAIDNLDDLGDALETRELTVILHGGDFDVAMLSRDFGWRFDRIFDTMIAATLLGEEGVGLAALVQRHFDVALDKKFQRADWGVRPVTPAQRLYLQRDTAFLPELYKIYASRLADADLEEEAEIEFARVAARPPAPDGPAPDAWRRAKGARRLDERGRAVLASLWAWREAESERRDRPPFKVVPPAALVAIAAGGKEALRDVRALPGLHGRTRSRYGSALLRAARDGERDAAQGRGPAKQSARSAKNTPSWDGAQRKAEDRLRAWRKTEAQAREVPNVVVLPNPALTWLVAEMPSSVDAMDACPDIGRKRMARYGDDYLKALHAGA